jgi:cytochrome c5
VNIFRTYHLAVLLATALTVSACGKQAGSCCDERAATPTGQAALAPSRAPAPVLAAAPPLPPELQAVYDRSCKQCHTNPTTGAPQVGDKTAWAERVKQGRETLLDHAVNGYKGMPPLGACMDCTEKELLPLIEYLSATKLTP